MRITNARLATDRRPAQDGLVRVLVRNTGNRTGTEVVQVYHGELPAQIDTPPKQLAGWARVRVQPGEQQWVSVPIALGTAEHLLMYLAHGDRRVGDAARRRADLRRLLLARHPPRRGARCPLIRGRGSW